ncbi:MAG TPA: lipoate--protein ligase [Burkholderiaceae bacterium]|nr:lipoate--protein ligase [Burkholderiaceae bacterium]
MRRDGLPAFARVAIHRQPLDDGIAREAQWLAASAQSGIPQAHLWHAPRGFVVPRRYTLLSGWARVAAAYGEALQVRSSGGGLVPQGRGIWNLTLAWRGRPQEAGGGEAIYRDLCDELAQALRHLGIDAMPGTVDGSFCDGRFNLAVGGRKLVGTAQAWRRVEGHAVVLAHAVILVDADPEELAAGASAFEEALGTATRYRAEALTCVARVVGGKDVEERTLTAIEGRFAPAPLARAAPWTIP